MVRTNLLGEVFGRLTVIADTRPKCLCRCTCGNEKLIARNKLPNGRQKSCGCEHGNAIRTLKRENALGVTAYRLTCIDNRATGVLRLWRCECGGLVEAAPKDVRSGNTKSCGCIKNERMSLLGAETCGRNNKGASQSRWRILHNGEYLQLRSGFELIYFEHLVRTGIAFEYEPKTFVLSPQCRYTPDFYLPGTDEWVEVKGHLSARGAEKIRLFQELGYKLLLVKEADIKKLLPVGGLRLFYETHLRIKSEVSFTPPNAKPVS